MITRPESNGSAPKTARAISVRPAPTSPAMPRISPRRTSRLTSSSTVACGSWALPRRVRPSTRSATSPGLGPIAMNEERIDLAADHQADDAVDGRVGDGAAADQTAVAKHRVAVADLHHLLEPMGDEDDAQALGLQIANDAEELLDLARGERRGRLVHDDQARLHRQRAGDLDHLLLGDRQVADDRHRLQIEAEAVGDRSRLGDHPAPVDEDARAGLAADEDVFGDRHVRREREFLVDGHDPELLRVMRRCQRDRARRRS